MPHWKEELDVDRMGSVGSETGHHRIVVRRVPVVELIRINRRIFPFPPQGLEVTIPAAGWLRAHYIEDSLGIAARVELFQNRRGSSRRVIQPSGICRSCVRRRKKGI